MSLYTLQFWRISTKAAPLWAAARFSVSSMWAMLRSTVRATKVAPAASANAHGLTGRSAEPTGVDLVTLPSSLVGEYWPLVRSEEHTSELQSQSNLVCRLLLEK